MATVLCTGANRGIGLELCRQLAGRGERVLGVCRSASAELRRLDLRVIDGIDVTDDASVQRLAEALGEERLDVLVNNAGLLVRDSLEALDLDAVRRQLEVNALGPLRVTSALLPRLAPAAKVVLITSRMGSLGDNGSGGYYGYRMSKAALNMAGVSLAHDLRARGVAVGILHPGFVSTRMTGNAGAIEPAEAARRLISRIDELTLQTTGSFWNATGELLPW